MCKELSSVPSLPGTKDVIDKRNSTVPRVSHVSQGRYRCPPLEGAIRASQTKTLGGEPVSEPTDHRKVLSNLADLGDDKYEQLNRSRSLQRTTVPGRKRHESNRGAISD